MTRTRSRSLCITCGLDWVAEGPRRTLCADCFRARLNRRLPTLTEWRQLATDAEVRAGAAAWARGVRDPLTAAMADEHRARVGA